MKTLILTSYFSKKPHPQKGDPNILGVGKDGRVSRSDFSYIEEWWKSVHELGLHARVFYDDLTEEFLAKYTTERIKFVKAETKETRYSNNDWRYFCYHQYLLGKEKSDPHWQDWESVFMTDCSDVVVVKDPSELFEMEEYMEYHFFTGKDIDIPWAAYSFGNISYKSIHEGCGWAGMDFFEKHGKDLPLINMGVVGSITTNVEYFLHLFVHARSRSKTPVNINMALGQFILRYAFQEYKIKVGAPVTSEYKKWQKDRKDVYFIHK